MAPLSEVGWEEYRKLLESVIASNSEQTQKLIVAVEQIRLDSQASRLRLEFMDRLFNGGNGAKPLDARLTTLEQQVDDVKGQLTALLKQKEEKELDDRRGEWQLRVALVSGLLALATALWNWVAHFLPPIIVGK